MSARKDICWFANPIIWDVGKSNTTETWILKSLKKIHIPLAVAHWTQTVVSALDEADFDGDAIQPEEYVGLQYIKDTNETRVIHVVRCKTGWQFSEWIRRL